MLFVKAIMKLPFQTNRHYSLVSLVSTQSTSVSWKVIRRFVGDPSHGVDSTLPLFRRAHLMIRESAPQQHIVYLVVLRDAPAIPTEVL